MIQLGMIQLRIVELRIIQFGIIEFGLVLALSVVQRSRRIAANCSTWSPCSLLSTLAQYSCSILFWGLPNLLSVNSKKVRSGYSLYLFLQKRMPLLSLSRKKEFLLRNWQLSSEDFLILNLVKRKCYFIKRRL